MKGKKFGIKKNVEFFSFQKSKDKFEKVGLYTPLSPQKIKGFLTLGTSFLGS